MSIKFLNDIGKNIPLGGAKLIFLKLIAFHSNGLCTYCDCATQNFIQKFNSHYLDLSKEVYNVSVPHGAHKIQAFKVRGLKRPSILLSK